MFATMVIVLQSPFTGGEAHLSHGGLSSVLDHSKDSLLSTSVMAWYTDVMHEIKPITSGYRLALSYNLIYTTTAIRPSLPQTHHAALQLKEILLSCKEEGYSGLPKVIYLLNHRYSQANLRGSALKGSDAHEVGMVNTVAEAAGFRIGLANVECSMMGTAEDAGGHGYGWGGKSSHDAKYYDFDTIDEKEWSVKNLVDLNGEEIADFVVCIGEDEETDDESEETIPPDLRKQVKAGAPDGADYEGYQGNVNFPHLTLLSFTKDASLI